MEHREDGLGDVASRFELVRQITSRISFRFPARFFCNYERESNIGGRCLAAATAELLVPSQAEG